MDSNKEFCSSHCCFIVTIQRYFFKDLLLSISISRTSLSLLFSPCYWCSLHSCSFTHIYNFPLTHARGSFAQSQPALLIFWQLFGKGAWATYTVYSIHAVTIYLGGLFWQGTHCQILTSAKMKTRKTAHNYTQSRHSLECSIFCNSVGRAAILGLHKFENVSLLISDTLEFLTIFNIR